MSEYDSSLSERYSSGSRDLKFRGIYRSTFVETCGPQSTQFQGLRNGPRLALGHPVLGRRMQEEEVREALQFVAARVRSGSTAAAEVPVHQKERELLRQVNAELVRLQKSEGQ